MEIKDTPTIDTARMQSRQQLVTDRPVENLKKFRQEQEEDDTERIVREKTKEGAELIEKQRAEIKAMIELKLNPVERMKMAHRHDDEMKELVGQYRSYGFGKAGLTRLE